MSDGKIVDGMQAWLHWQQGRYRQAIEMYSKLYEEDGQLPHIRNRGFIYLDVGDHQSALVDFKLAQSLGNPLLQSIDDYLAQGVCYWYLNQPVLTVELWRQSLTAPYTDAAGGVQPPALLLYAAERLQDDSLRKEATGLLRKHARRKLGAWPGAIVPFLLGKIDATELLRNANAVLPLAARWQCQADFYIALRALRSGDSASFEAGMIRCASSTDALLEFERYLARWEVQREFSQPAFPTSSIER